MIKFYGSSNPQYKFLSNFHVAIFTLQGHQWASVEHFYQAMKSDDPEVQARIRSCETPGDAKRMGAQVTLREGWEDLIGDASMHAMFTDDKGLVVASMKDHFMYTALITKFTQRKELRDALMLTGTEELVEDSPTDRYWGIGKDGTGQNKLGRMLQLIRDPLPNRWDPNAV